MTQVKSFSIKKLLLSLLLLLALLLFSACGKASQPNTMDSIDTSDNLETTDSVDTSSNLETTALVDTSGNYVLTTKDNDFTSFLDDDNTVASFTNGMHLTMDKEFTTDIEEEIHLYVNAYVKYEIDEDEVVISEMSVRMELTIREMTEEGELENEFSVKQDMYVKDGLWYIDSEQNGKFKQEMNDFNDLFAMISWIDADDILDVVKENTNAFDVKIATAGQTTKYFLTLSDGYTGDLSSTLYGVDIYIIFNNGQLSGIYMESEEGANKLNMVGFDENITFPDLTLFTDDAPGK